MSDKNISSSIDTEVETSATVDMAEGLSQFFGNARDVVARYCHCVICGANLHFTHVTDFNRNTTHETARCPECGVKNKSTLHRLQ